jgi:hypothetical protein
LLGDEPKILNLFDRKGINSRWLTENHLSHTNCTSEEALRQVMESDQHWDLVIATYGIDRFYSTTSEPRLFDFITWLKNHSKLCLVTPHHQGNDPTNPRLGPYRLNPQFTIFNYYSEILPELISLDDGPVVALSDYFLFDGVRWHERRNLVSMTEGIDELSSITESARRSRTFMQDEGYVIKSQIGCPDYFDSLEIIREAEVLASLPLEIRSALNLPRLLNINQGRAVSTVVRQGIDGKSLNLLDKESSKGLRIDVMKKVIDLAASYAKLGLFHNDFRPWNILLTPDGLQLIDFADISTIDQDVRDIPQILALVGTVTSLCNLDTQGFPLRPGEFFDTDLLEILRDYLSERDVNIGSLYGYPWLLLSETRGTINVSEVATIYDLLDALLAPTKNLVGP